MTAERFETFSRATIDSLRWKNQYLQRNTQEHVDKIMAVRWKVDLREILRQYLPTKYTKVLTNHFSRFPSSWFDLMRKLCKYRKNDSTLGWHIDAKDVWKILEVLLVRWRKKDIGADLVEAVRVWILGDQNIIEFASKQTSILDSSWHSFAQLPANQRQASIMTLIEVWLTNNIDKCNAWNIDSEYFPDVFPRILHYLEKIFGKKYPALAHCKTRWYLTQELQKMFKSGDTEDAWMIIQAFHAWARVLEIEELCRDAERKIPKLPKVLQGIWLNISHQHSKLSTTWVTIYYAELTSEGETYDMSWRVKSPESILQKMWQKSDYNNVDAMRDIIGMNIVYPDKTSATEKRKLLHKFAWIMPNLWYLIKNKGEVLSIAFLEWDNLTKTPLWSTEERSDVTSEDMENMSVSGFIQIAWSAFGCEVQFSKASVAKNKSKEDPYYKVRGAMTALMRWPKYRMPSEIFALLSERVNIPYIKSLGMRNLWDLIWQMIADDYLIPYTQNGKKELVFSFKGLGGYFEKAFPDMKRIDSSQGTTYLYHALRSYVKNDEKMGNNASLTTP